MKVSCTCSEYFSSSGQDYYSTVLICGQSLETFSALPEISITYYIPSEHMQSIIWILVFPIKTKHRLLSEMDIPNQKKIFNDGSIAV